jgi:hypothetical protein
VTVAALAPVALILPALLPQDAGAGAGRTIGVEVADCYTSMPDAEVSLDGQRLRLTPAVKRDDTVGLCFDKEMTVGKTATIRVMAGGKAREVRLAVAPRDVVLVVSARAMAAATSDKPVMLD